MNIVQCGLGYVGLLSAAYFALKGHKVFCYDIDSKIIQSINNGTPKSGEFLEYMQKDFSQLVKEGKIEGINSLSDISASSVDAYLISVPTERKNKPFMDIVKQTVYNIVCNTQHDNVPLIIIESTLTPGTVKEMQDYLERLNMHVDKDYYLAVAPRRDWLADPDKNLTNLRRVVGGLSPTSSEKARDVLKEVCQYIDVTSYEIAELTKSLENTLLNVQVATIEYLALAYPHIDVNEAIHLATTGHWRLTPLQLNSGIGGRCIPLALDYLKKGQTDLIENNNINIFTTARQIDLLYRIAICELVEKYVNVFTNDYNFTYTPNVVIYGMGYRKDFKDRGWSPGEYIYDNLDKYQELEYNLFITDPLFSQEEIEGFNSNFNYYSFDDNRRWNILVLCTKHTDINANFRKIMKLSDTDKSVVIDACGAFDDEVNIKSYLNDMGIEYVRIGSAGWKNV